MDTVKKVLLVHGLFMNHVTMIILAQRLEREGYQVDVFEYPARPDKEDIFDAFIHKVSGWEPDAIIGHSLGGNVALQNIPQLSSSVKKIVCLGSPINGSEIARKTENSFFGGVLSPAVKEVLFDGVVLPLTNTIKVGVIAGTNGTLGFGIFFRDKELVHDGTVGVNETMIDGLTDRIELDVGHTSMLFSDEVACRIVTFLKNGTFSL